VFASCGQMVAGVPVHRNQSTHSICRVLLHKARLHRTTAERYVTHQQPTTGRCRAGWPPQTHVND